VVRAVTRPAAVAGATLLIVYIATLAPGVTLWDSGEFLASIHSLGVPHPPGTPLYILVARVWTMIWAPLAGFAYSVNLLSAVCTALSCAILAGLLSRWTGDGLAAAAGAICAGAMSSVWLSANETEVYAMALLVSCILLWIGDRAGQTMERRWLLIGAYAAGLAFALHLTALLTLPAALYLTMSSRNWRGVLRQVPAMLLIFAIGASALLFMLVRARHDPPVNQGNPSSWNALADVIMRRQYAPAPPWPRQAPWFLQIGNLFEYADWQVALGVSPGPPPSWWRTPVTALYGLLGLAGFLRHRRVDRRSWRALLILFATGTIGVLVYLNLKAGPSYGAGFLPAGAPHEARERDYFFVPGFICWGLWAGFGAVGLMRRFSRPRMPWARLLPFAGAFASLVPVALNWTAVNRHAEPGASEARNGAIRILDGAPPRAVVLANGDNSTYPVWYMQEVERRRRDVTVVVVPLLPASWYRAELARRGALLDTSMVSRWRGAKTVLAGICGRAAVQGRPVGTADPLTGDNFPARCEIP
jgi:4-amino-4-deoxy-L-arabinose transferase-like glycosyltransferase